MILRTSSFDKTGVLALCCLRHPGCGVSIMTRYYSPGWCCRMPSRSAKSLMQRGWQLYQNSCAVTNGINPYGMLSFSVVLCKFVEDYMVCMLGRQFFSSKPVLFKAMLYRRWTRMNPVLVLTQHHESCDLDDVTEGISWWWEVFFVTDSVLQAQLKVKIRMERKQLFIKIWQEVCDCFAMGSSEWC